MQFHRGIISLILLICLLSHTVIAAQEGQEGSCIGEATLVAGQTGGFLNASSHWCASLGHCYSEQSSQSRHWSFEANQTTATAVCQDEQYELQRTMEMQSLPPIDQSYHPVLSKLRRPLDYGCRCDLRAREGEAESPSTHQLGLEPMDRMEYFRISTKSFITEAEKSVTARSQRAKRKRQIHRCRTIGKHAIVSGLATFSLWCDQFLYCCNTSSTVVHGEIGRATLCQPRVDPSSAEGLSRSSWVATGTQGHPGQDGELRDEKDHHRSSQIYGSPWKSETTTPGVTRGQDPAQSKVGPTSQCIPGGLATSNRRLRQATGAVQHLDSASHDRIARCPELYPAAQCQGSPRSQLGIPLGRDPCGACRHHHCGCGGKETQGENARGTCQGCKSSFTFHHGGSGFGRDCIACIQATTVYRTRSWTTKRCYYAGWIVVKNGSIASCLRKVQCGPLPTYKAVVFCDVEAYGNDCCAACSMHA